MTDRERVQVLLEMSKELVRDLLEKNAELDVTDLHVLTEWNNRFAKNAKKFEVQP